MARAGRKDRGLLAKKDSTGKTVWNLRLYHEGKDRRFGSFSTKTAARDFYEKANRNKRQGGSSQSGTNTASMRWLSPSFWLVQFSGRGARQPPLQGGRPRDIRAGSARASPVSVLPFRVGQRHGQHSYAQHLAFDRSALSTA